MGFQRFIGIDWSGAKGRRHKGIAIALAEHDGAVSLVRPVGTAWSREGVVEYLGHSAPGTAAAMDSSFSLPYGDEGLFLPGLAATDAPSLWAEVDAICAGDGDLFGGAFVDQFADYYQQSASPGNRYIRRYRRTETWYNQTFHERSESCYHLIGPSQIGKGGLATMRALRRLSRFYGVHVWPFDAVNDQAVTLFEAFATTWRDGHKAKIRDVETLDHFLSNYGCYRADSTLHTVTDDEADACLMAAGLRSLFDESAKGPYVPSDVPESVLRTEGWIITKGPPCKSLP